MRELIEMIWESPENIKFLSDANKTEELYIEAVKRD